MSDRKSVESVQCWKLPLPLIWTSTDHFLYLYNEGIRPQSKVLWTWGSRWALSAWTNDFRILYSGNTRQNESVDAMPLFVSTSSFQIRYTAHLRMGDLGFFWLLHGPHGGWSIPPQSIPAEMTQEGSRRYPTVEANQLSSKLLRWRVPRTLCPLE